MSITAYSFKNHF